MTSSTTSLEQPALEGQLREYEMLLEIGVELAGTLELERVLDLALSKVEALCRAETSSIWELDPERGDLFFRVVRGSAAGEIENLRVPLGKGIVGSVAQSGRAEIVADVTADPRWNGDASDEFTTRSILTVPLISRGRVVGVLQLLNPIERSSFSEADLRRMELFAGVLANALENARLYEGQRQRFLQTVTALAEAVERRDPYTGGHVRRVVAYSMAVGRAMGLSEGQLEQLRLAAVLHDIGKVAVPDRVLQKPERLAEDEESIMRRHPVDGAQIVAPLSQLGAVVGGIRHHHERLDGGGYPDRLQGDEIPLLARIIAVADTFDAMTTDRPYRRRLPVKLAIEEIRTHAGHQFCPDVVAAFLQATEDGEIEAASRSASGGVVVVAE